MGNNVLRDVEAGVATITINRPEKRNAMNLPTKRELHAALDDIEDDDSVRAVVFRGAGDNVFVAGGDLELFSTFDHMDGLEYLTKHATGLYSRIASLPKPTVAAVDGLALGGGAELALACDLRLATEDATIGFPEIHVGLFPAGGGTQRLATVVGAGLAKELVFTGRTVDAAEAKDVGLVNHVYPAEAFDEEVTDLATDLASKPPVALRLAKESINRSLDLEAGLDFERIAGAFVFGTDDQTEGAKAFLENREPEYEGR